MSEHKVFLTNDSNGHVHKISNVRSGYTDAHTDGHRHRLNSPTCNACRKARAKIVKFIEGIAQRELHPTDWVKGHLHYYSGEALDYEQ